MNFLITYLAKFAGYIVDADEGCTLQLQLVVKIGQFIVLGRDHEGIFKPTVDQLISIGWVRQEHNLLD